jgi:hypothetical protein
MITQEQIDYKIKEVENYWPTSSGKTYYLKYLNGGKLSASQSIKAHCADCCGGHVDGRLDCDVPLCPSYAYMPYNKNRTKGTKTISEENKAKMKAGKSKSRDKI